jgi:hypothetical protein
LTATPKDWPNPEPNERIRPLGEISSTTSGLPTLLTKTFPRESTATPKGPLENFMMVLTRPSGAIFLSALLPASAT